MAKVSIIIPSRNEVHTIPSGETVLQRMVKDILEKATGDFEVVVGFDGLPIQELPVHPNVKSYSPSPESIGLKKMINFLANQAEGEYIFKLDSHCMVGEGFDEILQTDMQDNWVVTPRFYVLDAKRWQWQDERFYDYFYLSCPFTDNKGLRFKAGGHWPEKTKEKLDILIDETPQMHGSGWFVNRKFFLEEIKGFPETDPMGHAQEPPYLGLKMWLGPWGGKLMVNKKTWYAHMHQDGNQRGYSMSKSHVEQTYNEVATFWLANQWEERAYDFDYFVEKFMPMPTWPENWREIYAKWKNEYWLSKYPKGAENG